MAKHLNCSCSRLEVVVIGQYWLVVGVVASGLGGGQGGGVGGSCRWRNSSGQVLQGQSDARLRAKVKSAIFIGFIQA